MTAALTSRVDYSPFAAFRTVDRYDEGTITIENLQDFFRSFGNYLIEAEIFAIIRRIDTDGDARLCFDEFADFFTSQVNVETALHREPKAPAKRAKSTRGLKGTDQFASDSTLGANIDRLLVQYRIGGRDL